MRRWIREHSLGLVFTTMFTAMLVGTLALGPKEWRAERQLDPATPINTDFWHWWVFQTDLSLQADVFGGLLLVLLTKHLWERGSAEAKDPPEDRTDPTP